MPRRDDLESVLLIGSGPIVIGQACEFDYSGTQACKALRDDGYRVILVNSNPATIMTDPEFSDRTYIEPLNVHTVERIIEKEKPDAILPTLGGQTGLNLASDLWEAGVLQKHNVKLLGATYEVIQKAEDRESFKGAMEKCGLEVPRSYVVGTMEEAHAARVRALVSETAIADKDRRGAERHAASMTRHRDGLREEIQRLETAQDELLDRFTAGG